MGATSITQLLKSFCDFTHWNYAVFWKLNHHFPMTLTWEDGYFGNQKTNEAVESMRSDINFKATDEVVSSSSESTNSSGESSVRLLMTEMSHLEYILGEGVVGKIALTGDHCWVLCEDILTSKFNTNLIPECPYEWLLQFTSGIKTIVLVPVLPQGVLQFGSFEAVAEDLVFVANIKEKLNCIHSMSANATPLSLGINIQDWSISALTGCLMENLDESPSITNNILIDELSGGVSLNINGSTRLNPTVPSYIQVEGFMSGKNEEISPPSTGVSNDVDWVKMKSNYMKEKIWTCSPWVNNLGVFGETSKGLFSYSGKDVAEEQFGGADTNHEGCKNVNSFFSFPQDSELHKALVPVASRQTAESESSHFSVEDIYSSSTLISNKKEHGHIKDLKFSKEGDAEYLLDAVVGNLCSASDEYSSIISNSDMSPTSLPIEFTASIHPRSHSEDSTLIMDNSDPSSHLTSAFEAKEKEDCTNLFTSASLDGNSSILIDGMQQEAVYSHVQPNSGPKLSSTGKKRARAGNTQRPRPRDRQLIMDRMKELRELVPDGARCSIDSLLDRTIKHMLYLRKITNQAEKLKQCEHKEVPENKRRKINGSQTGRSYAFDFGGELQACPIVIEDLECSGHMLIEMICSEHGLFLEIAQVIRRLELTILKGVLESRSRNAWARFIVEVPRGFHRMDVLCPLLHLLQLRRNPVSNRI